MKNINQKTKRTDVEGTVYLLHFSRNYAHAGHYLGFAEKSLDDRLKEHRAGRGARLTHIIGQAGIEFKCVRTWQGTRRIERKLKNRHDARSLCPECRSARREAQRQSKKRRTVELQANS